MRRRLPYSDAGVRSPLPGSGCDQADPALLGGRPCRGRTDDASNEFQAGKREAEPQRRGPAHVRGRGHWAIGHPRVEAGGSTMSASHVHKFDPAAENAWLLDGLSAAIWVFDIDLGRVVWANPAALKVWSADSLDELRARRMKETMSPAVLRRLQQFQADFSARNAQFTELWTLYPRGVPRTMRVRFSGVRLPDERMAMLCEGIPEGAIEPEVVRSTDALLHTQMMISLHRQDGSTLYLNPAARSAFEGRADLLLDRFVQSDDQMRLQEALGKHGEARVTARVYTRVGIRWHELTARNCLDPASGAPSILISATDVSSLKEAEAVAQDMAHRDSMTGLPNRLMVEPLFNRLGAQARANGSTIGVFFIDLDQFKVINDTFGHPHGDGLLREVARRLLALRGADDIALRLGGDEFLFLAVEPRSESRLELLAGEMLQRLAIPVDGSGRHLVISPSIGVARFPEHGEDAQTLLRHADWAMYESRSRGYGQFRIFNDRLRVRMERQVQLLADLKEADARGQFDVYYQPRHSVAERRTIAVEALARWHHPEHGTVPASEFIPLCERSGVINALGSFVLRKAMQQQRNWQDMGLDVAISVNISQQQLSDPGFAALLAQLLTETGCSGNRIELEITETLLVEGKRTVHENLDRLRALGMRIAIDDFGTGYSNLARLSDTEIHCIKIDQGLIAALPRNAAIVQTIIAMCKVMRVTIVAEGVETQQAANWASRHGCDELQGYLYGRPMTAADMQGTLAAERGETAAH